MPRRPIKCSKCGKPNPAGKECPWCAAREGRLVQRGERLRKKAAKASRSARSIARMVCARGHRWEAEVDPRAGVAPRNLICPECGEESLREGIFKGVQSDATCTAKCWLADFLSECKCACAGRNHGQGGPQDEDDE